MLSKIAGVRIEAIACAVPSNWLSLDDQFGKTGLIDEKSLKKFSKSVGVVGRYITSAKQTSSDLCFEAAEKILREKRIDRNRVGVLVYVTQTPDYQQPATAHVIQYRLGLGSDCLVFDINLGCSGFVSGLNVVGSLMMQSDAEFGLLLCGEIATRSRVSSDIFSHEDMIFGDAGSAVLLVKDRNADDMLFLFRADGSRFRAIIKPWEYYRHPEKNFPLGMMDGVGVFNFSTDEVPDLINELIKLSNNTAESYDYLVLHQANKLIMKQIERKTGFSAQQHLMAIDQFANTSSSSILVSLVHNLADSDDHRKLHFIMSGYGIGLAWNVVDCYINSKDILPLVITDEYFDDGYQAEP